MTARRDSCRTLYSPSRWKYRMIFGLEAAASPHSSGQPAGQVVKRHLATVACLRTHGAENFVTDFGDSHFALVMSCFACADHGRISRLVYARLWGSGISTSHDDASAYHRSCSGLCCMCRAESRFRTGRKTLSARNPLCARGVGVNLIKARWRPSPGGLLAEERFCGANAIRSRA